MVTKNTEKVQKHRISGNYTRETETKRNKSHRSFDTKNSQLAPKKGAFNKLTRTLDLRETMLLNLGPATSARVTLRQKRRKEGTEKREEKRTRSRRTKPNRSDTDQIQDPQVIKIKAE